MHFSYINIPQLNSSAMATGTAALGYYTASDTAIAMATVRRFHAIGYFTVVCQRYKDGLANTRFSSYRLQELPLLVAMPRAVQMRLLLQL